MAQLFAKAKFKKSVSQPSENYFENFSRPSLGGPYNRHGILENV